MITDSGKQLDFETFKPSAWLIGLYIPRVPEYEEFLAFKKTTDQPHFSYEQYKAETK